MKKEQNLDNAEAQALNIPVVMRSFSDISKRLEDTEAALKKVTEQKMDNGITPDDYADLISDEHFLMQRRYELRWVLNYA